MELTAAKRLFLYFPLRRYFEQSLHVRHRLERYNAGRAMNFDTETPEAIGAAIADALRAPAEAGDVERDGAVRAAHVIVELL